MVSSRRTLWRRTLRAPTAPTLIEGVMTRSDFSEHVTVEITGGPPGTTVMVLVSGTPSKRVHLDGCGVGSVQVALTSGDSCVEIASGERVLLTGRLPAAGCVAGSRS